MDRKYYDINTGIIKYDAVNNSFIRQTPNGILQIGGPKGDKGDTGDVGPKGDTGIQGKSAYQVWIDAGNIGTETDFINSLRGEPGAVSFTDVPANYDFVVDANIIAGQPMPNPWWRRFRSGAIEQGGVINVGGASVYNIDLPIAMSNDAYWVSATLRSNTVAGSGGSWANAWVQSATRIGLVLDYVTTWVGYGCYWEAKGF